MTNKNYMSMIIISGDGSGRTCTGAVEEANWEAVIMRHLTRASKKGHTALSKELLEQYTEYLMDIAGDVKTRKLTVNGDIYITKAVCACREKRAAYADEM